MKGNFESNYSLNDRFEIDYNKSKINKMTITESKYNDEYTYNGTFDVDLKYIAKTEDKTFNKVVNESLLHNDGSNTRSYNERCPLFTSEKFGIGKYAPVIHPEDDEAGTVNEAISDWLDQANNKEKIAIYQYVLGYDIPRQTIMYAWFEKEYNLVQDNKKIKSIDYDTRKPKIDRIIINYEDGSWFRLVVDDISNSDVDSVFPGKSLSSLRSSLNNMLEEDYDGTISLLSELFGFDLKTLKGAKFDG